VRKHGASTASRRAAPPSARFQRDRPEVGGVTHIVVVYDIWHYVTLNVGSVVIGYSMCFCCLRLKNKIRNYNDNRQFKTHVH